MFSHGKRRDFGLALFFTALGIFFTTHEYPQMHLIQVLFPLACGLGAGLVLGRGLWRERVIG
ncbi:MAG: hypothetical protein ABI625_11265 [bacterium]